MMGKLYKAKAKLNLFLHVLGQYKDGFHELQSLVYFPNIYDELSFTKSNEQENSFLATGEFSTILPIWQENSIVKVVNFFQENFSLKEKIQVNLQKNLPLGGGIGGGSSNAAVSIIAMNDLFNLKLSSADMLKISTKFGSDVPVCLCQHHRGAVFAGKGELVDSVDIPELPILLINPKQPLLTKDVFFKYKETSPNYSAKIENINNFTDSNSLLSFLKNTKNDLTSASINLNKNIADILENLNTSGAILSRMSGSGSTCFAIYKSNQDLAIAEKKLKILYPNYWIAKG
ncbi:MAG: 4-(cytidine 5'-diphospho)-2-C-methyl-D-erythritol kinase [Alphaproteobacteria bacterium]|jgi:4-diphosphocytidyl-2-C-methyl-D-erythritol kinase|nr:4-(cytidine 5'-diphospho)-2-C-methyl-D-erythritol kinase [Alphaproteobacteria bacterium]